MDKTQQLERRIIELEKQILALKISSLIPLELERAFAERGFVVTDPMGQPDIVGDWSTNVGFITNVTGFGTDVQSPATQYLRIKNKEQNWYIPVYTYNEMM